MLTRCPPRPGLPTWRIHRVDDFAFGDDRRCRSNALSGLAFHDGRAGSAVCKVVSVVRESDRDRRCVRPRWTTPSIVDGPTLTAYSKGAGAGSPTRLLARRMPASLVMLGCGACLSISRAVRRSSIRRILGGEPQPAHASDLADRAAVRRRAARRGGRDRRRRLTQRCGFASVH